MKKSGCSYKVMLAIEGNWKYMVNDETGKPVVKKTLEEALNTVKKVSPGYFSMETGKYISYPFEIVETCVNIEMVRHTKIRTVYKG